MKYEVVELKEKIVVGTGAVVVGDDPKMSEIIGGLWDTLYQGGIYEKIKNKANKYAIGLYTDYKDNSYYTLAGNEVTKVENDEFIVKVIPAGKYAKFSVHGNMTTAVIQGWEEINKMSLDRKYTVDFEEYLNENFEEADIDIYVAIN